MNRYKLLLLLVVLRLVANPVEFGSLLPSVIEKSEAKKMRVNQPVVLSEIRQNLRQRVLLAMPRDEAGVVLGVVLGIKSDLPGWMYNKLVRSGTIHIMVASGFNVMVVGVTSLGLLTYLIRRRIAVFVSVGIMIFYALIAGWQPPVVRALIMGAILMIGGAWGRRGNVLYTLLVTTMVMYCFDPTILTSLSFQLSVAACIGIFWLAPIVTDRLAWSSIIFQKSELLSTWSAQVTTAPLIMIYFGQVSYIALLSNVLILPMVPYLMYLGVATMILPMIFAWPTQMLAKLIIEIVAIFGV